MVENPLREEAFNRLTSAHRKVAFALKFNVTRLSELYGIERLGFFTLTFPNPVFDAKEASRRFNSLNSNVLSKRYAETIVALERHRSGGIHFHCVLVMPCDIRTGVDFGKLQELCDRGSRVKHSEWVEAGVGENLFSEWAFWRKTAKRYGFGRTELLPIKSNAEAIATYVGGYIAKHIDQREKRDKGVRLVRYSRQAARATARFAWKSPGSDNFRRKLRWLCEGIGCTPKNYRAVFREHFGEKWFWRILGPLFQVRFNWYPTLEHFHNDWPEYQEPGENPIFFKTEVHRVGDDEEITKVVSVELKFARHRGQDVDEWVLRQRSCLELLSEDLEEQKRRSEREIARHVPKFREFVRTAKSWLEESLPGEADHIFAQGYE